MRKSTQALCIHLTLMGILDLLTSFILWEINFTRWPFWDRIIDRFFFLCFFILANVFLLFITSTILLFTKPNEK